MCIFYGLVRLRGLGKHHEEGPLGYRGLHECAEQGREPRETPRAGRKVMHLSKGGSGKPLASWHYGASKPHPLVSGAHCFQSMTSQGHSNGQRQSSRGVGRGAGISGI